MGALQVGDAVVAKIQGVQFFQTAQGADILDLVAFQVEDGKVVQILNAVQRGDPPTRSIKLDDFVELAGIQGFEGFVQFLADGSFQVCVTECYLAVYGNGSQQKPISPMREKSRASPLAWRFAKFSVVLIGG